MGTHWEKGGLGCVDLAKAVVEACKQPANFKFLYDVTGVSRAQPTNRVLLLIDTLYVLTHLCTHDHVYSRGCAHGLALSPIPSMPMTAPIDVKIATIAREMYGAAGVELSPQVMCRRPLSATLSGLIAAGVTSTTLYDVSVMSTTLLSVTSTTLYDVSVMFTTVSDSS